VQQPVVVPAAAVLSVLVPGGVDGLAVEVLLAEELAVVEGDVDGVGVDVPLVGRRRGDPGVREVKPELVPESGFVPPDHRAGLEKQVEFRGRRQVQGGQFFEQNNDWLPPLEILASML
jgi:hypothetical protein